GRIPADSTLPPRACGSVTSMRAEHGAVTARTEIVAVWLPPAMTALAGALMHGSFAAMVIVCGDPGGVPTSTITWPLLPFATFCVAGPTPTSSFAMVTLMSERARA